MAEKKTTQSNIAILNQFIHAIGETKRPKNIEEAKELAKAIKQKWYEKETFITNTQQSLLASCNELMRLRDNKGTEHKIACAIINELGRKPKKKLAENPKFNKIIQNLKESAF